MVQDFEHEQERVKRLSPLQKALYFFWYLDAQVTNGGFIQFYYNGYNTYLPAIKSGLKLIGYKELLEIVTKSEFEYDKHLNDFEKCRKKRDAKQLYKTLKEFEHLDDWYYSKGADHYTVFEKNVRANIEDFIIEI